MTAPDFLLPKDIHLIYAMMSLSWCRRLCREIRIAYGYRHKKQLLSLNHFCDYQDLTPDLVAEAMSFGRRW